MATSGKTAFNPDISEIIEEAYERIGVDAIGGYDVRTARRSLNLLGLEWANRQVHLWTIDSDTIPLTTGVGDYPLPMDTVDLLDVMIRTTSGGVSTDAAIGRMSMGDYANIPTKQSTGRPVQYYVDRQSPTPTLYVWPIPPDTSYTLVYWRMRRMQDAGDAGYMSADVSVRAIPALVSGLAYYLAMKRNPSRLMETKAIYDEQFTMMAEEDRERVSFVVRPVMARM